MGIQAESQLERHMLYCEAKVNRLQDQLYEARRELGDAENAWRRSQPCRWCGAKPGNNVCPTADRTVYACTNYVEGD